MFDLYDRLKSITCGYASFEGRQIGHREGVGIGAICPKDLAILLANTSAGSKRWPSFEIEGFEMREDDQIQKQYGIKPKPKGWPQRQVEALEKIAIQLEALNRHVEFISVAMPKAD